MKNFLKMITMSVLLIFFMIGCAPKNELNKAKELIGTLTLADVEADRYVPEQFSALNDSLNAATVAIEFQKSKFFVSRNYKNAKTILNNTIALAETVKVNAIDKKEEIKNQTQILLTETFYLIEEVKGLIEKAPTGKEGRAALEAIQIDLSVTETSLNEIPAIIGTGDYLTAFDKIKVANDKVLSLKVELENAINKVK